MPIEYLGARRFAAKGFEVQRTNNFEFQVMYNGLSSSKQEVVTLAVVSAFLPSESNEVINLNYSNTTVTVAGKANVNGSGSFVVRDLVDEDMEKVMEDWRSTVYNKENDAIGFASDYKKNATITQYAPDGSRIRVWRLTGVWPSAVDYGSVGYDSPGVKQITMTLQYDKAILDREEYNSEVRTSGITD